MADHLRRPMHPTDGTAIFRPVIPNQPVATLLLIENSQNMLAIWPHLRDRHLPNLIGTLRIANPVAQIKILMLTSSPVDDLITSATGHREYFELPQVRFDLRPDNKISTATIRHGVELLASTDFGVPSARHIIIIAASAPAEDYIAHPGDLGYDVHQIGSEWHALAQLLAQKDIQCHMILSPFPEVYLFSQLFHETLQLQQFEETFPWFPTGGSYVFHLSVRPTRNEIPSIGGPIPCNNYNEQRPLPRDLSFPPGVHADSGVNELPPAPTMVSSEYPADVQTPTLVTRLQQAHGLAKKKIYSTKPARQPFFREDRVREKYRQAPTPLTIPISTPENGTGSLVHRDGPATRTKLDRKILGDPGTPVSPTDSQSHSRRARSWSRRGSRVSSPETETSLSSPTSMSAYSTVSPVLPTLEQYASSLPPAESYIPEQAMNSVGMGAARLMNPATELSWSQSHYMGHVPTSSQVSSSSVFAHSATDQGMPLTPKLHSESRRHSTASFQTATSPLHAVRTTPPSVPSRSMASVNEQTNSMYLSLQSNHVSGDDPFIFNDEDEITPGAELLRPSPSFHYSGNNKPFVASMPPPPRQNAYPSPVQPYMPPSPASADQYFRHIYPAPGDEGMHHPLESPSSSMSGTSSGTSSLTGWAG